jgi:hypothetical protein
LATVQGTRLTLSDTIGLAVDMSPTIQLIDPYDVGLLSYFGMSSLDKPATETEHQWMEDTLRPLTGTFGEVVDSFETSLVVGTDEGPYLRANDIILAGEEQIRVVTVDADNDTATSVVRGWAGTTADSHQNGSTWQIIGVALVEGDPDPGVARTTVKTKVSNYTQIFEDVVEISATLESVDQWAPGSEYARQLAKTMKTLMILLDKTLYYGKPYVGGVATPRTMAGIRHFIATNISDANGAELDEQLLLDLLHAIYEDGGNPGTLFMTLTQKRALNQFLGDNVRRTTLDEKTAGAVVDFYTWDNGTLDVVIDRWLPKSEVALLTTEFIGFGPLASRTLAHEILPKSSREVQKGQITGEYTAEVKSEKAHGLITNLDIVVNAS